ncbi:MAG TPA: DNA repair protein RecO [Candidatus Paceibacterota bacterium]|nr:DNA repair protein RecO [Candidatus Paceibacterota bacterium]
MNHIHHTEAIVLGGYSRGEADRQIVLYTRDLGLVRADARGFRKPTSKQRFALQPYMVAQVDLIVTKAAYRAGSTDLILSLGSLDMATLTALHRIASLVRRLVPEQEKNEPLYEAITEVINFLSIKNQATDIASLELLAVFRILFYLGYVTDSGEKSILEAPITPELLVQVALRREALTKEVNKSLKETML